MAATINTEKPRSLMNAAFLLAVKILADRRSIQ